jgi:hypothetical protein
MCYQDAPNVVLSYPCPADQPSYDCNHDDYFSTNPPAGSWLATHWNAANNSFLEVAPAPTPLGDGPAVASAGPGVEDVFARGGDSALWTRHFNGSVWSGWTSVGGVITSGPGAASATATTVDVFARGGNNAMWTNHYDGSVWNGWTSLGGVIASPPAPVSDAPNTLDVFARGFDSALWTQHLNGSTWSGWKTLGGIIK